MKVDIKEFMARHGLDRKNTAHNLFPNNRHAVMALDRIIKGDGTLNVEQVGKLATMAGVGIAEVFKSGSWTSTMYAKKILFSREEYIAELNQEEWKLYIFHQGSLFHEEILINPSISLTDFLDTISLKIAEHEFENVGK